jgi:hypothetical protein
MELLDLWDRAAGLPAWRRALVLLEGAGHPWSPPGPRRCSVGERDARLMAMREAVFGREASAMARCPACAETLEVSFDLRALRVDPPAPPAEELRLCEQGYEICFRLPSSIDLEALHDEEVDLEELGARLLRRCLISIRQEGGPMVGDELPPPLRGSIARAMAEADPQAQVALRLTCDRCGNAWREDFHIDTFFWAELAAWAGRLVNEVHQLACAYGWSEAQIVELGPGRRGFYLGLIAGDA